MKLKTLVTAVTLALASATVLADDKVKVQYVGLPQVGPSVIHAQAVNKALSMDSEFVSKKDCAAGLDYVDNNDNVISIIASTAQTSAKIKNIPCAPKTTPDEILYTASQYLAFCHLPDNKVDIYRDRFTIAHASVAPFAKISNNFNIENGTSMISIPVKSSVQSLASVLNGDTDYGFIVEAIADPQVAAGAISCPYTTNPNDKKRFVGKHFRMAIPDYGINWMISLKTDDPEVRKAVLKDLETNEDFKKWRAKGKISNFKTRKFTQSDINKWNKHIDQVIKDLH